MDYKVANDYPDSPCCEESQGKIQEKLSEINRAVNYMDEVLRILEDKIDPILTPPVPSVCGAGCDKEPVVNESEIFSALKKISNRIYSLADSVNYLRDRVEL